MKKYEKLAKALQKLPEESLSPEFDKKFWKKFEMEKNLPFAKGPAFPVPVYAFAGTLCAVGIFLFLGLFAYLKTDTPVITLIQGKAVFTSSSERAAELKFSQKVQSGDRITTNSSDWVILELENRYQIKIDPDSELQVQTLKPKFRKGESIFYLSKGQALINIGDHRQTKKYPITFQTPHAFAKAMGTQFTVSTQGIEGLSKVRVLKGAVEAGMRRKEPFIKESSLTLLEGQELFLSNQTQELKPQAIVEGARQILEEAFQFSQKDRAILLISMSPSRVYELLKPCAIYIRIESQDPELERIGKIAVNIQKAAAEKSAEKNEKAVRDFEKAILKQNQLERVPLLLFTGAYYTYLKNYQEAVRVFEDISTHYPASYYRSLSMMAAAILYERHLGETQKARSLASQILRDYSSSYETEEASRLLAQSSA